MFFLILSLAWSSWSYCTDFLPSEPQPSYPRTCSTINYRSRLRPGKRQGDTSYCFAYSSAELIFQRTGFEASALDLAMGFYVTNPIPLQDSNSSELQQYLSFHPGTPQQLEADRYRSNDVSIDGQHPFLHKLEGGFEPNTLLLANVRGLCSDHNLPSDGGFQKHRFIVRKFEKRALAGKGKPGPEANEITGRFRSPIADRFNSWWLRRVQRLCAHRAPTIPLIPVTYSIAFNLVDFYDKTKRGLIDANDQDRILASLDFALENNRIASIGMDLEKILAEPAGEDGDHSVAVIGRRLKNNECQYLVRDSSGYECNEYEKPLRARCHNRDVWLTESELKRSLYAMVYLR